MTAGPVGNLNLYFADASKSRKDFIWGETTARLAASSSDPRIQPLVPFSNATLKEDDIMIVAVKADAQGSIDSGTTLQIPVTIKNVTTGVERATFLRTPDFTTMAGAAIDTTDITTNGTAETDMVKYTVKAQERVKLGHRIAENSRAYASLVYT